MRKMGFSVSDMADVETGIAISWRTHPVIQGLKGVRKARIARPGTGKSGGGRVVYYVSLGEDVLLMLAAYAKSAKADLSSDDRRAILRSLSRLTDGD
jgi:hypothetical protein